ncbi:hypothetical protein [Streptomyces sp. SCUT-3]|uniref:hypothetical protein n=1 Tax=Streptomyces sp. SCUT-3 TaxID=2684469 RepID=UPI0031FCB2F3
MHLGPLKTVDDAGGDTVGNPAPVVDPASGDVVLLTCRTVGDVTKQQILRGPAAAAGPGGCTCSAARTRAPPGPRPAT